MWSVYIDRTEYFHVCWKDCTYTARLSLVDLTPLNNGLQLSVDHCNSFILSACVSIILIIISKGTSINESCSVTVKVDFHLFSSIDRLRGSECYWDISKPQEVINISMTGHMTAYMLVSSEMSGADGKCVCVHKHSVCIVIVQIWGKEPKMSQAWQKRSRESALTTLKLKFSVFCIKLCIRDRKSVV